MAVRRFYDARHLIGGVAVSRLKNRLKIAESIDHANLGGWAPSMLREDYVVWVNMRRRGFVHAFSYMDFLGACGAWGSVRTTNLDALAAVAQFADGHSPTGFIFHVSRCGSTLLRNMLAACPQSVVIGEPSIVNEIIGSTSASERKIQLRGAITALCQSYMGDEKYFFLKFSSQILASIKLFREVFPRTPIVCLYRDPVEVLVACLQQGGSSWLQAKKVPTYAARITGMPATVIESLSLKEYAARALGNFFRIIHDETDELVLPINYNQLLSKDVLTAICLLFGIPEPDSAVEKMRKISGLDAKKPDRVFVNDSESRQQAAPPEILQLSEKWIGDIYRQLDVRSQKRLQDVLNSPPKT